MEKRYWAIADYDEAIREIKFRTPDGERYPEYRNPETAPAIKKLVDTQNFLVILSDDALGLDHRQSEADGFFDEYRQLVQLYYVMDREDKFVYSRELIDIYRFGLELQLHYFKLGNDAIINRADDPEAKDVQNIISSNEKVVASNFNNYLDLVNEEDAMDEASLTAYCDGIKNFFPRLFEIFPNIDRSITREKTELMLNKSKETCVQEALTELMEMTRVEEVVE